MQTKWGISMRTKFLLTGICAAAVGVGTLTGSARADEMDDLKAQVKALKATLDAVQKRQQSLERKQATMPAMPAGTGYGTSMPTKAAALPNNAHPGCLPIPGSQSCIQIGGYVKVDSWYDVKGHAGDNTGTTFAAIPFLGTPGAKRNPDFQATARESRFNLTTYTPTSYGDLKTFIEADFEGSGGNDHYTNSYGLRLRHAYFTVGSWLVGQSWSTFMDLDTFPDVLDFGGPTGFGFSRQAEVRYTTALGAGNVSLAVENPFSDFEHSTPDNYPGALSRSFAPDLVAKYTVDGSWGHIAVSGIAREITIDTGGTTLPFSTTGMFNGIACSTAAPCTFTGKDSTFGWGGLGAVALNVFGTDKITLQAIGGEGIGRYITGSQDAQEGASIVNGKLRATPQFSFVGGYLHKWTDWIRSTVAYSHVHYFGEFPNDPTNSFKNIDALHANLIFNPFPHTDIGIEYIHGRAAMDATPAGATSNVGRFDRIQTSAKVQF
jgi:hypothetical protein